MNGTQGDVGRLTSPFFLTLRKERSRVNGTQGDVGRLTSPFFRESRDFDTLPLS